MTNERIVIRFPKGNKIRYWQDFQCYEGVPSGIDFIVDKFEHNQLHLSADGYGFGVLDRPQGAYGSGNIMIDPKCLTEVEPPKPDPFAEVDKVIDDMRWQGRAAEFKALVRAIVEVCKKECGK